MSGITAVSVLVLASTLSLSAQDAKGVSSEAAVAISPAVNCAAGSNNENADTDCEKRDTARFFLIAGQTEAVLRILCSTRAAIRAFDKFDGEKGCLKSVGLDPAVIKPAK